MHTVESFDLSTVVLLISELRLSIYRECTFALLVIITQTTTDVATQLAWPLSKAAVC